MVYRILKNNEILNSKQLSYKIGGKKISLRRANDLTSKGGDPLFMFVSDPREDTSGSGGRQGLVEGVASYSIEQSDSLNRAAKPSFFIMSEICKIFFKDNIHSFIPSSYIPAMALHVILPSILFSLQPREMHQNGGQLLA